jgi:hypothetical protein
MLEVLAASHSRSRIWINMARFGCRAHPIRHADGAGLLVTSSNRNAIILVEKMTL